MFKSSGLIIFLSSISQQFVVNFWLPGQFISAGLDKKLMFWDLHMKNGHAGCTQVVYSDIWSISLCQTYLVAVVGKQINVYDLRNLRVPVQIKESSMSYQIRCVRSFSSCEGT